MSKNLKIVLYLVERQTNPHIDVLYATIISKSVAADCVCDRELKKLLRTTLPPSPPNSFLPILPILVVKRHCYCPSIYHAEVVAYFFPCPFWAWEQYPKFTVSANGLQLPRGQETSSVCLQNQERSPQQKWRNHYRGLQVWSVNLFFYFFLSKSVFQSGSISWGTEKHRFIKRLLML